MKIISRKDSLGCFFGGFFFFLKDQSGLSRRRFGNRLCVFVCEVRVHNAHVDPPPHDTRCPSLPPPPCLLANLSVTHAPQHMMGGGEGGEGRGGGCLHRPQKVTRGQHHHKTKHPTPLSFVYCRIGKKQATLLFILLLAARQLLIFFLLPIKPHHHQQQTLKYKENIKTTRPLHCHEIQDIFHPPACLFLYNAANTHTPPSHHRHNPRWQQASPP